MWEFVCSEEIDKKTTSLTLKLTCNDETLKMKAHPPLFFGIHG
jgi:hypothetical protein